MSKLQKFYDAIESLQNQNINTANLESQLAELEEDIIREEIVPIIADKIEPILKQVRREVVLVVEYNPVNGIRVNLSRKRNVEKSISESATISNIRQEKLNREHKVGISRPRGTGMKAASRLRVTFMDDGTVISESQAVDTLKKTVIKFGPERVAELCIAPVDRILQLNRVNLVTKKRDEQYGRRQHEIGDGWLVFTCSNTSSKKRQIEAIAKALSIKVKVEIV